MTTEQTESGSEPVARPLQRPVRPRCGSCKHWEQFDEDDGEGIGTCRRYPPQRIVENEALFHVNGGTPPTAHSPREWSQPTTMEGDRCGEFGPNVEVQQRPAHDGRDPQDGRGPSAAMTSSTS